MPSIFTTMATDKKKPAPPGFEDSLKALQALVEGLEKGDVPLEELVAKFTEGHALIKRCQEQLNGARLRLEQLRQQDDAPVPMDDPESPRD